MKKQTTLRIAALLMAMLMVLAAFAGCKSKKDKDDDDDVDNSAAAVFRNALTGFVADLQQREELRPLFAMTNGGSMEIQTNVDVGKMAEAFGEVGYTGSVEFGGKTYFGNKALFLKNLYVDIDLPTENIDFAINGDFYMDSDYMYLSNDSVLGGSIGLIRGEMKKAFQNSVFVTEGLVDSESAAILTELFGVLDGDAPDEVSKELQALLDRYVKVIFDAIENNATYTELNVDDERTITLTIDEKAVIGILTDLLNTVKNDRELRDLIVEYSDMLSDYTGMSGAELGVQFDNLLAQLEAMIPELENEMEPGAIVIAVVTPTNASTLRKLTVSVRYSEGDTVGIQNVLTLDLGAEGIKNTNRISLNIAGEVTLTYEITKNDADAYKAALVASVDGDTMTAFTVEHNRKTNAFTFKIPEVDFALGGSLKVEGDVTTLVINSISYEGEKIDKGYSFTVIIDENDPMPKVLNKNEVTNLFKLDKAEFKDIMDRAENVFADIEELFDMMGIGGSENKGPSDIVETPLPYENKRS